MQLRWLHSQGQRILQYRSSDVWYTVPELEEIIRCEVCGANMETDPCPQTSNCPMVGVPYYRAL